MYTHEVFEHQGDIAFNIMRDGEVIQINTLYPVESFTKIETVEDAERFAQIDIDKLIKQDEERAKQSIE